MNTSHNAPSCECLYRQISHQSAGIYSLIAFAILFVFDTSVLIGSDKVPKTYDFSKNRTVGVYVQQSGKDTLDYTYASVISLHLMSLGYHVADLNTLLSEHKEKPLRQEDVDKTTEAILALPYIEPINAIIVAAPRWETAIVFTYDSQKATTHGFVESFGGWRALSLSSKLVIFDVHSKASYLSAESRDTCRLYRRVGNKTPSFTEYPCIVAARHLGKVLKDIPVCAVEDTTSATYRFPVIFYVDESYRKKFPNEWQERLQRRLLYASDIFRKQFDIQLDFAGFSEWTSGFGSSIEFVLRHLRESTPELANAFRIGVTLDPQLTKDWKYRSKLGIASSLGTVAVITAQPSFPGAGDWNSIEEALTLVHEIGHLLGAGHIPFQTSVMFPQAGSMSFQFDEFNKRIIDTMKQNFFGLSDEQRFRKYVKLLVDSHSLLSKNTVNILPQIARSLAHLVDLIQHDLSRRLDNNATSALLERLIPDSFYRHAVTGYLEYKADSLENARIYLTKAAQLQPDFAEVHSYLSDVLRRLGRPDEALIHRKLEEQYRMTWVDE